MPSMTADASSPAVAHDRGRRIDGEAGGEDGQATQQQALRLRQQLIAPVERRAQRPMPRDCSAAPAGQQREAIAQAGGHLLDPQHGRAGRGEFDGERYAVEVPADRGNRREVFGRATRNPKPALWLWRRKAPPRCDSEYASGPCARAPARPALRAAERDRHTRRRSGKTSRLVARIVTRGHRRISVSARFAAASMTCSQLSRTSRRFRPPMARATASAEISSPASFNPSTRATADGTRAGSDSDANSTSQPPSSNSARRRRADLHGERGLADAAGPGQGHDAIGGDEISQLPHGRRPANQPRDGRGKIGCRGCCRAPVSVADTAGGVAAS